MSLPFMVLPSGMPQIADAFFLLAGGYLLVAGRIRWPEKLNNFVTFLALFAGYIIVITTLQSIYWTDTPMLINVLFYGFNGTCALLLLALLYRTGSHGKKLLRISLTATCVLQCLLALTIAPVNARSTLFFDNPNQLGYFGLLVATLFLLLEEDRDSANWMSILMMACSGFLVALSISRAGFAGFGVLFLVRFYKQPWIIALCVIAGAGFAVSTGLADKIILLTEARSKLESDDSLGGRGYDRIFNNPEYLFFGAAEGGYYRFSSDISSHGLLTGKATTIEQGGKELHSTFGTLAFCYGIPGIVLFTCMVGFAVGWKFNRQFWLLVPIFVFGFTHQGIRETLFWVVLATAAYSYWMPNAPPEKKALSVDEAPALA